VWRPYVTSSHGVAIVPLQLQLEGQVVVAVTMPGLCARRHCPQFEPCIPEFPSFKLYSDTTWRLSIIPAVTLAAIEVVKAVLHGVDGGWCALAERAALLGGIIDVP
jgi:hypothetical protein